MQTYVTPLTMKRPFFQHAWLVLFLLTSSSWALAQSGSLVVSGSLKHEKTKERLDNVTVSVLRGGRPSTKLRWTAMESTFSICLCVTIT